ncbi:N5-glutamine methyltransferase family protein [Paenimyroides ceti]
MHMRRVDLVLQEVVLSAEQLAQWQGVLEQLLTEKPIQYVFSKAYFYGLEFSVNEHTLIPRPETEELVEWIIHTVKQQPLKQWRILDIGTGSGCIPVTLAKNISNAVVTSMDVSEKALEVAKEMQIIMAYRCVFYIRMFSKLFLSKNMILLFRIHRMYAILKKLKFRKMSWDMSLISLCFR